MAAFTDYKALDFSGLDKSINSIAQRQQLSKLGQGIDGTPEGFAKAGQSLLALGDIGGATNMFALSEKARERSLTEGLTKSSPFNATGGGGMGTPRSPVAPALPALGQSRPGESGYKPVATIANSEAEVQALEGSTGTPGQKVAARLINNGLTPTAAAGIAGNLNAESRFRTDARNRGDGRDGSDSIGLAQWNGPRAQALQQFAAQQGKDWRDPNVQSDFIAYELRTTEGRSGAAIANAQTPQQAGQAAIGYFRPQGFTSANPMGALQANERVAGANQFVLGGEPAPASGSFAPQTQVAQAPAEPSAPGQPLGFGSMTTEQLSGYLNDPSVPPNVKAMMQGELQKRQGVPSAPQQPAAPVQVAQAPVEPQQPGNPVADMPAQAGSPVQDQPSGFRVPQTLPPNDLAPNVSTQEAMAIALNPKHPHRAFAAELVKSRQAYAAETAPDKRALSRAQAEKAQLEIEQLRRNSGGYRNLVSPEDRAAAGIPADDKRVYQVGPDGKLSTPPGGTTVNVDSRTESEYAKANGKAISARFEKIVEEGDAASQEAGVLAQLRNLGGQIKNMGTGAALQAKLAEFGIKVGENVSEIEAYGALIDKMVPQQKVAGAGSTSDFDAKMFKGSLPGLMRTPGGNEIILTTLEALNTYKRQRADVVAEAMATNAKPSDVIKALKELPDPFAAFKESRKAGAPGAAPPPGAPKAVVTPQDYQALKSGDTYTDPQGNVRKKP